MAREWFNALDGPVTLDSAGKYGAGLALESLGRVLRDLSVPPGSCVISNKLGWRRVPLTTAEPTFEPGVWAGIRHDAVQDFSRRGIVECWEQGNELLNGYSAEVVSCHDPDEYLAAATDRVDRQRRLEAILEAYEALFELKQKGYVKAVGVGAKEWEVIEELSRHLDLDWVMFACAYTVYSHPKKLRRFMGQLRAAGTTIINSAVFHAGFLTGGEFFDYRRPDPREEPELFRWRDRFFSACQRFDLLPAKACVEFALRPAAIGAIALNTARASRVHENVEAVTFQAPAEFWRELQNEKLIEIRPDQHWDNSPE